jgi:hypothetical protein
MHTLRNMTNPQLLGPAATARPAGLSQPHAKSSAVCHTGACRTPR